jgi:hypothetical protein
VTTPGASGQGRRYYGKYRGTVVNNIDVHRMGQLLVRCPHVLGPAGFAWAMPCVPFAGPGEGFYMLPNPGANVWVEFEEGDPRHPIWTGCFWLTQGIPPKALLPTVRTITTRAAEVTLDDTPGAGGVTLKVGPPTVAVPCTVSLSVTGIEITVGNATIKLDPATVDINHGALKVI